MKLMTVDKEFWMEEQFFKLPTYPCPECGNITLSAIESTFNTEQTGASIRGQNERYSEPEWIRERFASLLRCNNPNCAETAAISGLARVVETHGENPTYGYPEPQWAQVFIPKHIYPMPTIFSVIDECPLTIKEELSKSFSLFLFDSASSLNSLRMAVEAMMTDKKIKMTQLNNKNKKQPLPLHSRIEIFRQKNKNNEKVADLLLAVKWRGNVGSHKSNQQLTRRDVLEGYEIFEEAINLAYSTKRADILKSAKAITANKGKPTKKKPTKFEF